MANELRITLPRLFPVQQHIAASTARFNAVSGGRESGKTALAIDLLLASRYGALQGFPVAFLLPDAESVLKAKRRLFGMIPALLSGRLDRPRVDLLTGGAITFQPLASVGKKPKREPQGRCLAGNWKIVYCHCHRQKVTGGRFRFRAAGWSTRPPSTSVPSTLYPVYRNGHYQPASGKWPLALQRWG